VSLIRWPLTIIPSTAQLTRTMPIRFHVVVLICAMFRIVIGDN